MTISQHAIDAVSTPPSLTGKTAKAWLVDLEALFRNTNSDFLSNSAVALWVIECSWAHPIWHSYLMTLIHLRPLEKCAKDVKFYLKGATHEMWIHALDPDGNRQALINGRPSGEVCPMLTPINFTAQFIEPNDYQAIVRCENAIQKICDGLLSPDTDQQRHWIHLFGNNMVARKRLDS